MSFYRLHRLLTAFLLISLGFSVQGQTLAEQKCLEYQHIPAQSHSLVPLVIDPLKIDFKVFDCASTTKLIIGGEEAKIGEFPHHALLGFRKGDEGNWDFRCGGTLISEQHVLTAAHCFEEGEPEIVRFGEYNITADSDEEYDGDVGSVRMHPSYSFYHSYHDIALIKLKYPIIFSNLIRPACLWQTEDRNVTSYIATGFGYNESFGSTTSAVMMKVELDEFSSNNCGRLFKYHRLLKEGMSDGQLCVGSKTEGHDTCQGDSGGPLQVVTNAQTYTYAVVGITSFGSVCGVGEAKATYTKVSHYIDWIEDNVWGANAM